MNHHATFASELSNSQRRLEARRRIAENEDNSADATRRGTRRTEMVASDRADTFAPMAWDRLIPANEWATYLEGIEAIDSAGTRFVLGGAFGLAAYTQRLRNTKDLDVFVLPKDREAAIDALTRAGFADYFEQLPYDRGWIYRSIRDEMIVDVIWGMPNRRCEVDPVWFERAKPILVRDRPLFAIPAEELLWIKLYVLQRDRCDWPDVFNLIDAVGPELDWAHLLDRLAEDAPLLRGALSVFNWLCPARARDLPADLFAWLQLPPPEAGRAPACSESRIRLLDTRGWFAALQPDNEPMKL